MWVGSFYTQCPSSQVLCHSNKKMVLNPLLRALYQNPFHYPFQLCQLYLPLMLLIYPSRCSLYYLHHSQINRHFPSGKGHVYCCSNVQYVLNCYQLCHHTQRGIITPCWPKTSGIYHWIYHHPKISNRNKKYPTKPDFVLFRNISQLIWR